MANPVLESTRERYYRVLLDYGLRLTKPRRAMLDYLFDRPGWRFKAEELYQLLNAAAPGMISRATVYRTLELLEDARVMDKFQIAEGCCQFQLSESGLLSCHYHLVDTKTGRTVSFSASREMRTLLKRICSEHGFKEEYHVLQVYGEFRRRRRKPKSSDASTNGKPPASVAEAGG